MVASVDSYTRDRGMTEGGYFPTSVETTRITNVNIDDWSVDAVSEYGNKRYFDLQVMNPYFHFANGEGFYSMPEVGALCWVCRPSAGRFAAPFILGYQAPHDEENDGFRASRLNLNPGDMMMRTRDENFLILRRGGVVQIGSTPICQTMYVPIQNIMRHFCENFELNALGGEMLWRTDRDDQTTDGSAPTTFFLNAKNKANESAHAAKLSIGSHGENNPLTLKLVINESGARDAEQKISLEMDRDGNVSWDIESSWSLVTKQDITMVAEEGAVSMDAGDTGTWSAQKDVLLKSAQKDILIDAFKNATMVARKTATVDGQFVKLGDKAVEPGVLGNKLAAVLNGICTVILGLTYVSPSGSVVPVIGATAIVGPQGQVSTVLSPKVKVE
jgi:hypothetical protein